MREPSVLIVEEGGRGGVAGYTAQLADALARQGWKVDVATARDHVYPAREGVTVHRRFPYLRDGSPAGRLARRLRLGRPLNGLAHLAGALSLVPLARRRDVIHLQGGEWPPLTAAQVLALRAAGRPVVHTPHNTFERDGRTYRRAQRLLDRTVTAVVVHSEYDRGALGGRPGAPVSVIPVGDYASVAESRRPIDAEAARRRLGVDGDDVVALLFGQLRPDKGIRDLLVARREVDGLTVVLAGSDGGGLDGLGDLLDDDHVVVRRGFVPDEEADVLFAAADVVALPYHRASASAVLLLAYGYRRPVVIYPVGGLPEYVDDGTTGWVTAAPVPRALAQTLRAVVAAGRAECRARGETAKAMSLERFGWEAVARETAALYRSVSRPPPAAP